MQSYGKVNFNSFRAYQENFAEFEITYEGKPDVVGIDFSLDAPTLNTRSIEMVKKDSGTSIHGVSFFPHKLRVGDTVYYKLFIENDGKKVWESDLQHLKIQDVNPPKVD